MAHLRGYVRSIVLFVMLAIWVSFPAAAEVISVSVPFISPKGGYVTHQEGYHTFRIPGMIVTQDGSVLVFAEGRRGDGSDPRRDENAPIDLVMRRSTDNGRTWQPMVVIDSGFRPGGDLLDFADPTPVLETKTGTVFVFYGQWPDFAARTAAHGQSAHPQDRNQVLWLRSSTDNGRTWSDRKQVVYPDEPHETSDGLYWRYAEPGPGSGIQLQWQDRDTSRNGRLVIPAKRGGSSTADGPVTVEPFVFYSDDQGKSWQVGKVTPGPEANEDEVVELIDGQSGAGRAANQRQIPPAPCQHRWRRHLGTRQSGRHTHHGSRRLSGPLFRQTRRPRPRSDIFFRPARGKRPQPQQHHGLDQLRRRKDVHQSGSIQQRICRLFGHTTIGRRHHRHGGGNSEGYGCQVRPDHLLPVRPGRVGSRVPGPVKNAQKPVRFERTDVPKPAMAVSRSRPIAMANLDSDGRN